MRLPALTLPIISTIGGVILLTGCATLSKEQCTVGNWQAIGYTDGVAGHYADRLAAHAKACAKAGVAPDYQAWERGRQQGLKQYCTTSHAFALGRRGRQLNGVCPASTSRTLQKMNAQGREYYTLSNQLRAEKKQLEQYRTEYLRLREGEMLNFKSEKEARNRLLSLPAKMQRVKQRIANAETRLATLQRLNRY